MKRTFPANWKERRATECCSTEKGGCRSSGNEKLRGDLGALVHKKKLMSGLTTGGRALCISQGGGTGDEKSEGRGGGQPKRKEEASTNETWVSKQTRGRVKVGGKTKTRYWEKSGHQPTMRRGTRIFSPKKRGEKREGGPWI